MDKDSRPEQLRVTRGPRLQFVVISDPAETKTVQARKLVRSQAARESQAKIKRARAVVQVEPAKLADAGSGDGRLITVAPKPQPPGSPGPVGDGRGYEDYWRRSLDLSVLELPGGKEYGLVIPAPRCLLATTRRDPFDSFVRSLSKPEQFLLDHCEFSPH